jgi:hypothetical protein
MRADVTESGPYSPSKDANVEKLVLWYLEQMRGGA